MRVRPAALNVLLVLAVLAAPRVAGAQLTGQVRKTVRVGILSSLASDPEALVSRLSTALRPFGWTYPENLQVDVRVAPSDLGRLPRLAAQLVQMKPDALVALWNSDVKALMGETRSIPIVVVFGVDPVGAGLVEKLLHPTRLLLPPKNVTGVEVWTEDLASRQLGLLKQAFPAAKRVGFVWNPGMMSSAHRRVAQRAARGLSLTLVSIEIPSVAGFEGGMHALGSARVDSLYVDALALFNPEQRAAMLEFAAQRRLPAIYAGSTLAERGGLMSYNASVPDLWHEAAGFVDAILRGAKPEQLSLRQATKFELTINLKTARVLGLTIMPSLLRAADHVIE